MVELWRKDIFQHARLVCVASWATDAEQIDAQEALFPSSEAIPFGSGEALLASDVYAKIKRPRGREIDIAIAACAIAHDAQLWTVNPADFKDIPNLASCSFRHHPPLSQMRGASEDKNSGDPASSFNGVPVH